MLETIGILILIFLPEELKIFLTIGLFVILFFLIGFIISINVQKPIIVESLMTKIEIMPETDISLSELFKQLPFASIDLDKLIINGFKMNVHEDSRSISMLSGSKNEDEISKIYSSIMALMEKFNKFFENSDIESYQNLKMTCSLEIKLVGIKLFEEEDSSEHNFNGYSIIKFEKGFIIRFKEDYNFMSWKSLKEKLLKLKN